MMWSFSTVLARASLCLALLVLAASGPGALANDASNVTDEAEGKFYCEKCYRLCARENNITRQCSPVVIGSEVMDVCEVSDKAAHAACESECYITLASCRQIVTNCFSDPSGSCD